jgi:hypothetical protein
MGYFFYLHFLLDRVQVIPDRAALHLGAELSPKLSTAFNIDILLENSI